MLPQGNGEGLIERYLLGELAEEEQVRIEDRAFADASYMSEIESVEADLIDAYVKGELPQSKREQFKTYFLTSPSRRSKLEFAKALATVSLDSNNPAPCEWREVLAKAPPAFSREALSRVDHSLWRPTPFEGVDAKILSANQVTGSVTSILRMRAGSRYPAHRHATDEHTFVLEGDADFGDRILYAGDYQVAKGDTSHQAVTTIAGCMVLVMSNVADQVLG